MEKYFFDFFFLFLEDRKMPTTLSMVGSAKKVRIDKDNTTIDDGAGIKNEIQARCTQIRLQIEETTSDYDKEKLQERLVKRAPPTAGALAHGTMCTSLGTTTSGAGGR